MRKQLFTILLLFCNATAFAGNEKPKTVLILSFDVLRAGAQGPSVRDAWPDLLTAYLTPASDRIALVDRSALEALARERGIDIEGLTAASLERVRTFARADVAVTGSVRRADKRALIEVRLIDIPSSQVLETFLIEGEWARLSGAAEKTAARIAERFGAKLIPLPDLEPDPNPAVTTHLIEGLGYFQTGQWPNAVASFMAVRRIEPDHAAALYWMGRAFEEADLVSHARRAYERFLKNHPRHARTEEARARLAGFEKPNDAK